MEDLMQVAVYICNRYNADFNERIDEMKLHKLLYFAQREALIQRNEPLFEATFYGWKFGPILKEIREVYKEDAFDKKVSAEVVGRINPVMDKVFEEYAGKDSWSLSRLTHGELSWKNSRMGISEEQNSDNPIALDDIRKDAERIRARRKMLKELGLA